MSGHAEGVLPDPVSRDPRAESWLVFLDLAAAVDVAAWLENAATPAVAALLAATVDGSPAATCTIGFGAGLFEKAGTVAQRPLELAAALPSQVPADSHDVVFYLFALSDAPVATFLRTIGDGAQVAHVSIERGYQRPDKREVFGQLDGLRNVAPDARAAVAFIGDDQPDEPGWSVGGSYMAYLKITQNLTTWNALTADQQAQIIGRSLDGTRLDQAAGTDPTTEPPFADASTPPPPACSHVRKAGPRGAEQDPVKIFCRGTPFIECDSDGRLSEGLQFVSYQASVDSFLTILQRWMLNENFPTTGTGIDSLVDPSRGLTSFVKGGLFFAVPHDDRFIGASMFDAPTSDTGQFVIRLAVVDSAGAPDATASLEGATFQITNAADASGTVLATVSTDAAGHAVSPALPVGVALMVTQTAAPQGAQIPSGQQQHTVTLERCVKVVLRITSTRIGPSGGYGG